MKNFGKLANIVTALIIIASLSLGVVVRMSYTDNSNDYENYSFTSFCTTDELKSAIYTYGADSIANVYDLAQLVVVVKCSSQFEMYKENTSSLVEVTQVLKGDAKTGDNINVLEFGIFDHDSKSIFCINGIIPFIESKEYLLFLNVQENHDSDKKVYYITTESALGKYALDRKSIVFDEQEFPLKECQDISFIAYDSDCKALYDEFYIQAMKLIDL